MISLHAMTDRDFAGLLGEAEARVGVEDGGIAPPEVIAMLRGVAADLQSACRHPVAWLVLEDGVAAGMISLTRRGPDGRYEIGYGTAPARRRRGIMAAGVAALLPLVVADGHPGLTAETATDNPGSQRVLERNGFVRTGMRDDPEDGALVTWAIDLRG